MIRSQKTTKRLEKILLSAEGGAVYDLPSERDAVNLRQKIYHFKRSILRQGGNNKLSRIARQIMVSVDQARVEVSLREPDYMDSLDDQL